MKNYKTINHHKILTQKILIFNIALLISISNYNISIAADFLSAPAECSGLAGIPANQMYKYDPKGVKALLRQGCPPPTSWNKAVNHELIAGGGATGFSDATRVPAHASSLGYKAKGACSDYGVTKAGGISDDGAVDPCKTGNGKAFFNIKIPMPHIPTIGSNETNCMGNLIEQLLNGNATLTLDLTTTGTCAVGTLKTANVGQCGVDSKTGSICQSPDGTGEVGSASTGQIDKPFSRVTNPKYVMVSNVTQMKYINNPLNQMTAIYLPNGGTVTFKNNSYTLDKNMFVTMNAEGEVFFGPNWNGNCEESNFSSNCRIILDPAPLAADPPAGSFVSITPAGGVVNIDSAIFEGQTLNKQSVYAHYQPTNNVDNGDSRKPNPPQDPYDPRINVTEQIKQNGPGPQNCISADMADLAGLPPAQDGCVGAQRVGLSDLVLDPKGEPTLNCPPSLSLFCVEEVNENTNDSAPQAKQQE